MTSRASTTTSRRCCARARRRLATASDAMAAAFVRDEERRDDFLPEFELLHAHSGEQGYELVRQSRESGTPVAVAYVDIRMPPGMDLRENHPPHSRDRYRGRADHHDRVLDQAALGDCQRHGVAALSCCT